MKIFIWQYISNISTSYHDNGGVAIIASDIDAARALFLANGSFRKESSWSVAEPDAEYNPENKDGDIRLVEPDFSADIDADPRVFIFPDAGCC